MKKENGITLISLIITIVLMIIIASTTVYTSVDRFKINNRNKMYNDIELLNSKIDNYYIQYGGIPILRNSNNEPVQYTFSSLEFDKNVNDNETYYIVDLSAIGDFTLNYGKEGYEKPNTSNDVYIMNEKTHTVYYVKGIEYTDGKLYHSMGLESDFNEDAVPPTKPTINIIEGTPDRNNENNSQNIVYYTTSVTIEFVPGKDNSSGVNKTTYSVNNSAEIDISTLNNYQYTLTENGSYEIIVRSYDNQNNISTTTLTININK